MKTNIWRHVFLLSLLLWTISPAIVRAEESQIPNTPRLFLPSVVAGEPSAADAARPEQTAGAYLVGSANPLTSEQLAQLSAAGAQVVYSYKNFGGAAVRISKAALKNVSALPFVTSVNPDSVKQLDAVQAVPLMNSAASLPSTPYWLDQINAEASGGSTGAGVWVAVLDSGFYPNWRDYFDENSILQEYSTAFVAVLGNPNPNQWDVGSDPHGMAVAATIVGHRFVDDTNEGGWGEGYATGSAGTYWIPGVAPQAKIITVKVCEPVGCFGSAINAGVDYITSLKKANPNQPMVINMSLGGPAIDPTEQAALDAAVAAGVVVVASAGNSGNAGMGYPAAYEPVISVGAGGWTQQWNEYPDKRWWLDDVPETGADEVYITGFSSRQLLGQYLDVISAGRYLLLPYPCAQLYKDGQVTNGTANRTCASKATPDNANAAPFQYLFMSGTSFSSPALAGIIALMLEKNPTLNNVGATPTQGGPLEIKLETSALPIAPGSVTLTHRTGETIIETWGENATGHGWVTIDGALGSATKRGRTSR